MAILAMPRKLPASALFSLALLAAPGSEAGSAPVSAAAPRSAKSTAGEGTWRTVATPGSGSYGNLRPSLVRHGKALFAASDSGVFRSRDGCRSWQRVSREETKSLASDGRKLYAGGMHDMFRSADDGGTWASISGSLNIDTGVKGFAFAPGNLYALVDIAGVFRSRDGGESWTLPTEGVERNAMFAVAASGATVLVGTMRGVSVSRDNGATWRQAEGPGEILSLLVHEGRIFAGTFQSGVWSSDDLGVSWNEERAELDADAVFALCAWKGEVVAGTGANGVFRFESARDIWTPLGNGLETRGISALAATGSELYAAGDSARIWCLGPGCAP